MDSVRDRNRIFSNIEEQIINRFDNVIIEKKID